MRHKPRLYDVHEKVVDLPAQPLICARDVLRNPHSYQAWVAADANQSSALPSIAIPQMKYRHCRKYGT
jgi:hypothetical protein